MSTTDALGNATTFGYDAAGNLAWKADLGGSCPTGAAGTGCTRYAYDAAGQLTGITYSDGTTPNVTYAYGTAGQRATMTDTTGTSSYSYDSLGRLKSHTDGAGAAVGYGYDLRGSLTSLTYPGLGTVSYTWDDVGRPEAVTDWADRTYTYGHDANGNTTGIEFPTGTNTSDTFAYDHADRMTSSSTSHSGTPTATALYERDPAGAVTSVTQDGLPGNDQTYGYDALDQLCYAAPSGTGTCDQPPTGATSFTYDAAGNLTAGPTAAIQRFNTANQLCWTSPTPATGTCNTPPTGATTYSYDTRGNRTTTTPATGDPTAYVYDQANRLTATTGAVTSSYTYDGDGLRTASTIEGATSQFTWSQAGGLPLVLNDGTNAYLYGTDGLPLAHQDTASGDVAYYHHDQLGSTRLLTATDGATIGAATYDPYGTPADSTGEVSPLGFAGQYTDPHTGLQYLRARYYDPTTGQFLTRDPLESLTGEAYGYASNDPANYSDPTGTFPWLAAIGAAVGGFVVDAGSQVVNNLMNGCEWSDVNWGRAALTGVATGATVVGLGAVANGLRGVKALQVASSATAKVHGNSAASPARAYLYRLSDAEGNYLKTGISQNPMSRYTKTFMQDKEMQILQSGNRREMLNLERFIVERDPGPLNRERWAGKYSWDVPS